MVLIKTPIFTADVRQLLSDDESGALQAQIRMILIYRKDIKDDLTPKEKIVLRKVNAQW